MGRQKRVLVVEDDPEIRELLGLVLEAEGYQAVVAAGGADALASVKVASPDLILLDMRMPVMDGWAFSGAYRRLPGPHAPIIAVTAATDPAERAALIGAAGVLTKPFDLADLLQVLEQHAGPA